MRGILLTVMAALIIFICLISSPFWISWIHEAVVYHVGWTIDLKDHEHKAHPTDARPFWISVIVSFIIYFLILIRYIKWRATL